MRKLFSLVLVAAVMFSCGDTGIAFNVSKELPVTVPFGLPFPDTPAELDDLLNVNPPSETLEYSLDEVGAFSNYIEEVQSGANGSDIVFNKMSYQIDGVDAAEANIALDEMLLSINVGSQTVDILSVTGNLSNTPKTEIPLSQQELDALRDELLAAGNVTSIIVFDLASTGGATGMDFDFTLHFDVTLKVREGSF